MEKEIRKLRHEIKMLYREAVKELREKVKSYQWKK